MVNAGDNIRQLARRRKKQAIEKLAVAGVLIVAPFLLYLILGLRRGICKIMPHLPVSLTG